MQTRMGSVSSNDPFISHYTLDRMSWRVLVGLSFDETSEFERLDVSIPHDRKPFGATAIVPLEQAEIRWLEPTESTALRSKRCRRNLSEGRVGRPLYGAWF